MLLSTQVAEVGVLSAEGCSYLNTMCGNELYYACRRFFLNFNAFDGVICVCTSTQMANCSQRDIQSLNISQRTKQRLSWITLWFRSLSQSASVGAGCIRVCIICSMATIPWLASIQLFRPGLLLIVRRLIVWFFLNCEKQFCLKRNVREVCMGVYSPIVAKAVSDLWINTFDKVNIQCALVV